jgi:Protein of unknown function (DUF1479)
LSASETMLTEEQIRTFQRDGVLVVDRVLSAEELDEATLGVREALAKRGIDADRLEETGQRLQSLSSTRGSGGVLDVFYEPFKIGIATHESLFRMTTQLWESSLTYRGESIDDLPDEDKYKWHPFGRFNPTTGYSYIDRLGYRIPTELAERLGSERKANGNAKGSKRTPIQRSLTPHLDCCPENRFRGRKWKPIQCFVALTDNLEENTGGFEAAKGFHRTFDAWARDRPPSFIARKVRGHTIKEAVPAPCAGEYTHIRPKEDRDVMDRIRHVPVRAGAAVFWDHRIPHANAYRNDGTRPRCVVYTSFLPDVAINREYVREQLENMKMGRQPTDTWIESTKHEESCSAVLSGLNANGRCLLGIDPWPEQEGSVAEALIQANSTSRQRT